MSKMIQKVDKDLVSKVKRLTSDPKYSQLTYDEIALLCGTSATTVSRVVKGTYDRLLSEPPVVNIPTATGSAITKIPYEELKYLHKCEAVIDFIFANAELSTGIKNGLFIPSGKIYESLKELLPERVDRKVNELKRKEVYR